MTIKKFSDYLVEEEKQVFFTFSRMNPPSIASGKLLSSLSEESGKYDYKVYLSQVHNSEKDPLVYESKVKHVRKMFPKHARKVIMDESVRNVLDVAKRLYDSGYTKINMVVGEDRVREFEVILEKYNGVESRHGFYKFRSIDVISTGMSDPDTTKLCESVSNNDFVAFSQNVPSTMTNEDTRRLFNDVRKGMGLNEEKEFKNHIELQPVSETREQYISGDLFQVGDSVIVKETNEVTDVIHLGANYVITETNGVKTRRWLESVEPIVEYGGPKISRAEYLKKGREYHKEEGETSTKQDSDIKDKKGTQPARYHKGLKKSTKVARDAHFKKHGKKSDDDASAYKPAPGDATAKTKPSKYTKAFKDMYEEVSQRELNDLEKFADRLLNKFDVDIEFTRHFADRMNDKRNKPAITVPELKSLFKKMADNKGKKIKKYGNKEAILKDIQSDLNLPIVVNWKNGEFEVVHKTIMRKKNFKSPDPEVKYESVEQIDELLGRYVDGLEGPLVGRFWEKIVNADVYKTVIATFRKELPKSSEGQRNKLGFMDKIARRYGANGRSAAEIFHKLVRKGVIPEKEAFYPNFSMKEETDPVKTARNEIEREKESDKKKHDKILDRARLARAKQKNRETK